MSEFYFDCIITEPSLSLLELWIVNENQQGTWKSIKAMYATYFLLILSIYWVNGLFSCVSRFSASFMTHTVMINCIGGFWHLWLSDIDFASSRESRCNTIQLIDLHKFFYNHTETETASSI